MGGSQARGDISSSGIQRGGYTGAAGQIQGATLTTSAVKTGGIGESMVRSP